MNRESLKDHFDLLLLAVVSAGAAHGYLIARRLAEASGGSLDLKEGALLALFGLALGLAASLYFAELISGMPYDVAPTDVATLGLVALTLILVALVASAVPACRASEVDPVQALREE